MYKSTRKQRSYGHRLQELVRSTSNIDVAIQRSVILGGRSSEGVLERLCDLFVRREVPDHIRSDNSPEFTAERVRDWLQRGEVKTLFIEPGSPWENGYIEFFNGKLRDELLKPGRTRGCQTA